MSMTRLFSFSNFLEFFFVLLDLDCYFCTLVVSLMFISINFITYQKIILVDETDMESKVEKNTCDQPNLVC